MSLKEIAKLTGTSVSTVSRVLNHPEHRCNDAELAKRIWDAAAKLNYTPNTTARNLRLGRSENKAPYVVDIFLTRFDSLDKDVFFLELFQYLKEELLSSGCLLGDVLHPVDILNLAHSPEKNGRIPYQSVLKVAAPVLTLSGISRKENTGLIILGKCPSDMIPVLKKRYSCIAGIDRNPTDYEYDEVVCNGTTAAQKAMEYLISLGHKNIAYIGDCTYEARYIGYYQALLDHRLPLKGLSALCYLHRQYSCFPVYVPHAHHHPHSQKGNEPPRSYNAVRQEKPAARGKCTFRTALPPDRA